MTPPTTDRPTPPAVIGGYRLLDRIGEGGMGVVHLAEDDAGHRVALKVLRPHVLGDDEGRQRLAREVASLSQVHSPHVAEVVASDPWAETPYVALRFIDGISLRALVRDRGPMPDQGLGHVASTLLAAVQDVHRAGVLHRDIKPTNVVMEGRSPVLIDFGIARLAEDPRLTATGLMLGTPGYLAPEVLAGEQASAATDVHGWAATVVYAATGRSPYGTGHTMGILDRTRRGEVDLSDAPSGLQPLLAACLTLDPRARPSLDRVRLGLDAWVRSGVASGFATDAATALASPPAPPTTPPPAPPTRASTVIAPAPEPAPGVPSQVRGAAGPVPTRVAPTPEAPQRPPGPLRGAARLCRALVVTGLLAVLATGVGLAPYVALGVLAVVVGVLRSVSRAGETAMMRRWSRGRRWYDVPQTVLGYPWHLLVGSLGALVLLLTAAVVGAGTVGVALLAGTPPATAMLGGGLLVAAVTWTGPGSRRVRQPVRGWATTAARAGVVGWVVAATLWLAAAGLLLALGVRGTTWTPADAPPWAGLSELPGLDAVPRDLVPRE